MKRVAYGQGSSLLPGPVKLPSSGDETNGQPLSLICSARYSATKTLLHRLRVLFLLANKVLPLHHTAPRQTDLFPNRRILQEYS